MEGPAHTSSPIRSLHVMVGAGTARAAYVSYRPRTPSLPVRALSNLLAASTLEAVLKTCWVKVYFISTRPRPGARRSSAARAGPEGQCAMYAAQAGVGARRSGVGDVLEQIKIEFSAVAEESNACQRQRDEYQHKCRSPPTLPPTHRKQSHPQSRFASWLHSHTAFWARSGRRSILNVLLSA